MRASATLLLFCTMLAPALSPVAAQRGSSLAADALATLRELGPAGAAGVYRELLISADTGEAADLSVLHALSGLGISLALQGEAGEARAHLERALRLHRRLTPDDDLLGAELLHGLARADLIDDRHDSARAALRRELALLSPYAEERPEAVARAYRELAYARRERGNVAPSRRVVATEVELCERALRTGSIRVPASLEQIVRDSLGDRGRFRLHALRAVAISEEPIWRDDAALADSLRGVAASYVRLGDTIESMRWYERAWLLRPPAPFERGFAAYGAYPDQKAFAMALDAHGRWTFGFFTGEKDQRLAVASALRECRRRLSWLGIDEDCRIYALNDLIVWEPVSIPRLR